MKNQKTLYFDYQATTPVDERVLEAMIPYFCEKFGNPSSNDHYVGWEANKALEIACSTLSNYFGIDPDQLLFTSGASEANNLVISSFAQNSEFPQFLYCPIDHKSIIAPMQSASGKKTVKKIPVDKSGTLNLDFLENALREKRSLVSIVSVNNEIGTIQPYAKIAEIVHQHNGIFHCDASQAPSALSVPTLTEVADFVSFSAHKMYGPKGIGALVFFRESKQFLRPMILGGGQQGELRAGTIPVPLCVGFAKAAEIMAQKPKEKDFLRHLRDLFFQQAKNNHPSILLNGPGWEIRHPGNLNIRFPGHDARGLLASLQPRLAASMGSACNSGIPEPSYVLREIGLSIEEAQSSIRFSLGRFTTEEQIFEGIGLLSQALKQFE